MARIFTARPAWLVAAPRVPETEAGASASAFVASVKRAETPPARTRTVRAVPLLCLVLAGLLAAGGDAVPSRVSSLFRSELFEIDEFVSYRHIMKEISRSSDCW